MTGSRGNKMFKKNMLFTLPGFLLLVGCSTNYSYDYDSTRYTKHEEPLKSAMRNNNLDEMAKILRTFESQPYSAADYGIGELEEKAFKQYSRELYVSLVDENSLSSRVIGDFDSLCMSKIGRLCAEEERSDVIYRNSMAVMEQRSTIIAREKDLDSGYAEIQTPSDARHVFTPRDGSRILFNPLIQGGDNQYYEFTAFLTNKQGSVYLSWWPDASWDLPAIGCILNDPVLHGDISFNQPVTVIGKYVENEKISLTNGGQSIVPTFSEAHVFAR